MFESWKKRNQEALREAQQAAYDAAERLKEQQASVADSYRRLEATREFLKRTPGYPQKIELLEAELRLLDVQQRTATFQKDQEEFDSLQIEIVQKQGEKQELEAELHKAREEIAEEYQVDIDFAQGR